MKNKMVIENLIYKKMKVINNFGGFINEEYSKNDPIPEINRMSDKLGIVLLGLPGSGKSTFAKRFIVPHNPNIKTFSTDDVSYLFTKDKSKFHVGSSELNIKSLKYYIKSGQNFIYDTTGSNDIGVFEVTKEAHKYGYKIMFILILIDVDTAKNQNKKRGMTGGHLADDDYIDFVYSRQLQTTKSYLKYVKPDAFYVVLNKDGNYKYYKFDGKELKKRKVDKYVSFLKESHTSENEVDKIVDTMLDFIDEGEKIRFKSATGDMTYSDYLEKNIRYQNFKPVLVSKNKTVSKFSIVYSPKDATYNNLMVILENMQSAIGRLGDDGWTLSGFEVNKVFSIFFEFSKPSIQHDNFELPDEVDLRYEIEKLGFRVERLTVGDSETELEFGSYAYDGELPSEESCEDKFQRICDIFGFSSFDLDYRRAKLIFEY
ncbi:MAG: AAA family ATPase [Mycobacterium sp.]